MLAKLAELDAEHAKALAGGGEKYVERHHDRGKLPARERIELLRRPGLAVPGAVPAGGVGQRLHGRRQRGHRHRRRRGRRVHDHRQRPDRQGRRQQPVDAEEDPAGQPDRAARTGCRSSRWSSPAARTCPPRRRSSSRAGRCSATSPGCRRPGIPTIALVFGNSTAGGAYVPGMSDYVVMVKERSKVFLAGPPLVKMATGEESDDESLGGAEMHARTSGLADYFAVDELDAIRIGRRIVARLNWRKQGPAPEPVDRAAVRRRGAARHRPADLKDPVRPARGDRPHRRRLRLRRVQAALRLVAGHRLGAAARLPDRHPRQRARRAVQRGVAEGHPVHPAGQPRRHAAAVPAQHHRLHGRQGVRAGRDHQARRDDDQRRVELDRPAPLADDRRVLRRRPLRHVRTRVRPAVPVRLAERQVGGDGRRAAGRRAVDRRPGRPPRRAASSTTRRPTPRCAPPSRSRSRRESLPLFLSGMLYDDGVIDPRDTRTVLGICLSAIDNGPIEGTSNFGVFRM